MITPTEASVEPQEGRCVPDLNPQRLAATGYVDAGLVNPKASVNKWTCEDWGATHQTYFTCFGKDPCPDMAVDTIHAFIWQDPTTPNAAWPSIAKLGSGRKRKRGDEARRCVPSRGADVVASDSLASFLRCLRQFASAQRGGTREGTPSPGAARNDLRRARTAVP
jgi:hypothetical protein